jgi:hypothetical protein
MIHGLIIDQRSEIINNFLNTYIFSMWPYLHHHLLVIIFNQIVIYGGKLWIKSKIHFSN